MNVQKRQSANEENGSTTAIHSMCLRSFPSLCSTILLFGIHTMNESSLFRVVFAAVLSFRPYSILGLGFIQEIGTTTHQIKYQRVIHIPTSHSPTKVSSDNTIVFKFGQ